MSIKMFFECVESHPFLQAVAVQPVTVSFYVDPYLQFYSGGIYKNVSGCNGDAYKNNHHMLIVGYNSQDGYWIAKNSWGTKWGDRGYIFLAMESDGQPGTCNMCGLSGRACMRHICGAAPHHNNHHTLPAGTTTLCTLLV